MDDLDEWADDVAHADCQRKLHRLKRTARDAQALARRALDELEREKARTEFLDAIAPPSLPVIKARTRRKNAHECVAVAVASDWHIEERVLPEEVRGLNDYHLPEARARAARFFRAIAWKIAHLQAAGQGGEAVRLRRLFLAFLGDIITGEIHEELAETNELTALQATNEAIAIVTTGVEYLLEACELPEGIDLHMGWGNHGRLTKKSRIKRQRHHNLEWLMGTQVAKHFEGNPRVRVAVAKAPVEYAEVMGWRVRLMHGDNIRYGGGIGGLTIPVSKKVLRMDQDLPADLTIMGHFHTLTHLGQPHVIVNGSLIGPSEYSQWIGAAPEPPAQAFFCLDRERGLRFWDPIWVAGYTPKAGA